MNKKRHSRGSNHQFSDCFRSFATYFRMGTIWLLILIQLALFWVISSYLKTNVALLYVLFDITALITVFSMINRHDSSAYRIAWIVIILILPIFGLLLYSTWGKVDFNKKEGGRIKQSYAAGFKNLPLDTQAKEELLSRFPNCAVYATALENNQYPVFSNTSATYYPTGEQYFEQLLKDLETANTYIFIEYFIIASGELWNRIHEVLLRKLKAGIEVRLMYDDVGCFFKLPSDFDKVLREEGFHVAVFSPAHRFISDFYMNYRNHQKIVVIDGRIGYTGGVNIADEYANIITRFGNWKDGGIKLEGSAVRTLTVTFLQMWAVAVRKLDEDIPKYLLEKTVQSEGFIQPYADGPANNPKNPALDLIRQAAGGARRYLWLASPYLVLDHEIISDFCLAARGGVDVRIIVPAIPDHFYVGIVNQENYSLLLKAGVHIYEYTPGFIHSKLMVFDDICATVGTINLDYRSLFLHYENGIFLCGNPAVFDVKLDFEKTFTLSHEITLDDLKNRPWHRKVMGSIFYLFSPLM